MVLLFLLLMPLVLGSGSMPSKEAQHSPVETPDELLSESGGAHPARGFPETTSGCLHEGIWSLDDRVLKGGITYKGDMMESKHSTLRRGTHCGSAEQTGGFQFTFIACFL